ncbi:uncharacterized protein BDR25DRAFT_386983 [Lindgomyces ingoldianus]|uniref:Uncharacterized protein n=1 Tax=Lindgomyces ingoldianus TaxID=673940 RepID=A0ACB6Q7W8_9PLEO|nr:uncharacterized protein BDR25DRAFT_386983 [Lindgomyces ingoldianus]KAF2462610.1 hypothetical protein BDR25DRAFT_386983 [Lindgomyces ingoldianus]
MTSLLFPTSDHPAGARRKPDYAPFMSDVARAASDAADALNLFRRLVEGTVSGADSAGFMAFDAHGGDTGCQLRAGMMLEIFILHRYFFTDMPDTWKSVRLWIDESTTKLQLVHENAKLACMNLIRDKVHPNRIGLSTTEDTPENMLRVLGWEIGSEAPSLASTIRQSLDVKENEALKRSSVLFHHFSAANTTRTDGLPLVTAWDPLSIHTVARFVVFCYVLSKYKIFSIVNGTVGARLAPENAAEASYSFIRPYTDKKKRPGKPQRTLRELAELQSWLSDLSCAWQRSLAQRSIQTIDMERRVNASISQQWECLLTHPRLIMSSVQQSDKGLVSMACYPGYLLARETWASMNFTLLLIDRHFCNDSGFHYNVFTATMGSPTLTCPCHLHPLGLKVTWALNQISLEELINDADSIRPHLVIMGNSINGGHAEYMQRFADKARPHNCPTGVPCTENEAHVKKLLEADHDRLALSFFASHKAYAFPVSDKDGRESDSDHPEIAFVERRMDTWADTIELYVGGKVAAPAKSLKESWRLSRGEANEMGTGAGSMHIFAWQHAFLETKGRVARRIQKWMEIGELMPLHAPIS